MFALLLLAPFLTLILILLLAPFFFWLLACVEYFVDKAILSQGLSGPDINNKISKLKVKLNTISTSDNTTFLSKLSDTSYNPEKVVKALKEPHKQLSKAEIQTILIKYNYGDSVKDIAERFGCCTRTITKILKENGITPTKQFAQRKAVPEIVMQLYADWYKPKDIAEIFFVSTSTILQVLKKNNVYIWKAWEYPRK